MSASTSSDSARPQRASATEWTALVVLRRGHLAPSGTSRADVPPPESPTALGPGG